MARDAAYYKAEKRIEEAGLLGSKELSLAGWHLTELPESLCKLTQLQMLGLSGNELTSLPESLGNLTQLCELYLSNNQLKDVPENLGRLSQLQKLRLSNNQLTSVPKSFGQLSKLSELYLSNNQLKDVPESFGRLSSLQELRLDNNQLREVPATFGEIARLVILGLDNNKLTTLPESLTHLAKLQRLDLSNNPLNPELKAAYHEGLGAVLKYLNTPKLVLNEAKLILIGEGEVGKSSLLAALRSESWVEKRPTTHGIEIKTVDVVDLTGVKISLNGWDFGGQPIYRPTHQLFFSAPAVYLVVWKPREGPRQGAVKEWIKLVKHREPEAKILVVATHGGPNERQPDIDRQEIWDLFGKETVLDFFHVDNQTGTGINELKAAITKVAVSIPETKQAVSGSWAKARTALKKLKKPYLPLKEVFEICQKSLMDEAGAELFVTISHRLGHFIHYNHDPTLRDIVILKPDWLATAISYALDDKVTREQNGGLVKHERLALLWNDPKRPKAERFNKECYSIFRSLMRRYDLAYDIPDQADTILVTQLIPDVRPEYKLAEAWPEQLKVGDTQQTQICNIVDNKHQSATAEGLFYWLIARLHKYSLGRAEFAKSVHWQRGLMLEDDYGSRAFLEHIANDIRITVRSPYPTRFMSILTNEVEYLVRSIWKNLRCSITIPCLNPLGSSPPCSGGFEIARLMKNKLQNRPEQECQLCGEWQNIEWLLSIAQPSRSDSLATLVTNSEETLGKLEKINQHLVQHEAKIIGRFDGLESDLRNFILQIEAQYDDFIHLILDEAKEGPRLFTFEAIEPRFWDKPKWLSTKYRLTLWCEHARVPLPMLNGKDDKRGVYEVTVPREWVVKSAPYLKLLTSTLSLILPVASSGIKLAMNSDAYKEIEKQLVFGEKCLDAVLKSGEKIGKYIAEDDAPDVEKGLKRTVHGGALRQFQIWMKEKDSTFGGLVRVRNKRQEILWVHEQYATLPEYE